MKNISKKIKFYRNYFSIDKNQKNFLKFIKSIFFFKKNKNKGLIIVENNTTKICHYSILYLLNGLIKKYQCKILVYNFDMTNNFKFRIFNIINIFINNFFFELLKCLTKVEILKTKKYFNKNETLKITQNILRNIKTKKDFYNLKIYNIKFGNILYDHYLKKNRVPTINIKSDLFINYLRESINLIVYWKNFFNQNVIKSAIITHGTYWSGIIAKFAINKNIPVYISSIEDSFYLSKKNSLPYKKFLNHKKKFLNLYTKDERNNLLKISKQNLDKRMRGKVGVDMRYSKKTAWKKDNKRVLKKNNKIKILIATHCFFDSPNGLGDNLFPDFYEWICFLAKISNKTDYDWYIKTHPDFLEGNEKIIKELSKKFKNITILKSTTSHHSIIRDRINFILTVNGSVGIEYAYMNKYVINASKNNPSINYNFNFNPLSINSYEKILMNLKSQKKRIIKKEVLECYLMQRILRANNIYFKNVEDFKRKFDNSIHKLNTSFYNYLIKKYNFEHHEYIMKKIDKFIASKRYYL